MNSRETQKNTHIIWDLEFWKSTGQNSKKKSNLKNGNSLKDI